MFRKEQVQQNLVHSRIQQQVRVKTVSSSRCPWFPFSSMGEKFTSVSRNTLCPRELVQWLHQALDERFMSSSPDGVEVQSSTCVHSVNSSSVSTFTATLIRGPNPAAVALLSIRCVLPCSCISGQIYECQSTHRIPGPSFIPLRDAVHNGSSATNAPLISFCNLQAQIEKDVRHGSASAEDAYSRSSRTTFSDSLRTLVRHQKHQTQLKRDVRKCSIGMLGAEQWVNQPLRNSSKYSGGGSQHGKYDNKKQGAAPICEYFYSSKGKTQAKY